MTEATRWPKLCPPAPIGPPWDASYSWPPTPGKKYPHQLAWSVQLKLGMVTLQTFFGFFISHNWKFGQDNPSIGIILVIYYFTLVPNLIPGFMEQVQIKVKKVEQNVSWCPYLTEWPVPSSGCDPTPSSRRELKKWSPPSTRKTSTVLLRWPWGTVTHFTPCVRIHSLHATTWTR